MSCENSWNQKLFPFPPPCIPSPAVFNRKDRSISFLPCPLPRSELNMIQDLHLQNHQILRNEYSTNQCSLSVTRHLSGSESRIVQGWSPLSNQLFVNGPNIAQNSNLLQHTLSSNKTSVIEAFHPPTDRMPVNKSTGTTYLEHHQLSSEGAHMIHDFHPVTHQLSANESNISQQSLSLIPQLPSNGISMNRNSNMFNQQLSRVEYLPTHVPLQNEFGRNQVKYPPNHQQSERESIVRQGLHSIFERHSKDRLNMLQNYIPSQQSVGNQGSYPLSADFPEMGFNRNRELSVSDASLHQTLYPQYSEKVHICVIGPPRCGKADLIRTFANNDDVRISTDKPLSWVFQQGMVSFGTTLKIDVWYGEDLTSAAADLRSLCQSSKSAIVLVYSVAQKSTLLTVLEWIKILKSHIDFNVPIILIGSTTDAECSCASREFSERTSNVVRFSDGIRVKSEYDLAVFYEKISVKCVKDVERIFLIAALKAFCRTKQNSVRVW
ncbi:hypothetical protein AVEN_122552-1 [Araneus ventricosus]|uniref:Uncharacterized protein n=1 Tax=Araneus ventricosus TaxID=182803 RepID=A0A4Y2IQ17_ARAVE|nr:hypothetical protein AVEN_122552-1 [Araneus ventricosus]